MRSITRLFSAFGTLADSLLSLASVVDTATAKLRLQLAEQTEPPALIHGGEVLDNAPGETSSTDSANTATKRNRKAS